MRRLLAALFRPRQQDNIFWLTPVLAVGDAAMARNVEGLQRLGVRAVLDLQAEGADGSVRLAAAAIEYLHLPVQDFTAPSMAQFDTATTWILYTSQSGRPILIHCRAGLGRSVTVAIATLLRMGYDLSDAYKLVRQKRPGIALSDPQVAMLRRFAALHADRNVSPRSDESAAVSG